MDRIDVDEVKAGLLGAVSRETADEYWNCLSAFLSAKLTKFEFDCQVYSLLGSENVPLHNQLVKALIRNAYSAVPSFAVPSQPSGPLGAIKREPSSDIGPPGGSAKRLKTSSATTKTAAPSASAASGIVRTRVAPRRPSPVVRQLGSEHMRLAHDFGGATTPSSWALRNRMYKIAIEAGLTEISPDAVNLMTFAMEHHLKDILSSCKRTRSMITPSGLAAEQSPITPTFPGSVFNQPEGAITARDMLTMVQHRPYLLGEDLPVNQERILLMQEDY